MPTIIQCAKCGETLAVWKKLPDGGHVWYEEFYDKNQGKCSNPTCNHKLPEPKEYTRKMNFETRNFTKG